MLCCHWWDFSALLIVQVADAGIRHFTSPDPFFSEHEAPAQCVNFSGEVWLLFNPPGLTLQSNEDKRERHPERVEWPCHLQIHSGLLICEAKMNRHQLNQLGVRAKRSCWNWIWREIPEQSRVWGRKTDGKSVFVLEPERATQVYSNS